MWVFGDFEYKISLFVVAVLYSRIQLEYPAEFMETSQDIGCCPDIQEWTGFWFINVVW